MKHYEMLCVLPGTLSEDEIAPMVQSISQVLGNYNVQNVTVEDMGKSRLAYPIKLIRYGYFQLFRFELQSVDVEKMEKSVRLVGGLLRVVVQISDPKKEKAYVLAADPTALSAPRKSDEERREEKRFERKPVEKIEEQTVKVAEPVVEVKEETPVLTQEEPTFTTEQVIKVEEVKEDKKEVKTKRASKKKTEVSLDNIDERLDEILQQDIDKV